MEDSLLRDSLAKDPLAKDSLAKDAGLGSSAPFRLQGMSDFAEWRTDFEP